MSGAVRAGQAFVEVSLKDKVKEGARKIQSQLTAIGTTFRNVGAGIATAGATATAAFGSIAGAIGAAALNFASAGSELADMSARTGIAASSLSALGYVAKLSGSDLGQVEGALRKMQKLLGDAAGGSKQASDRLTALGLSADKLLKMRPEDQFSTISQAIARIEDPTLQASAAMEVFGKTATQILPLINANIAATIAEAKALGVVMSDEDAAAADELGDSLDKLKTTFSAIYNAIGAAVAGPLTAFANVASGIVGAVGRFINSNRELAVGLGSLSLAGLAAGGGLLAIGGTLFGLGAAVAGVAAAAPILVTLWGTVTAAIAPALPIIAGITAGLIASAAAWAGIFYIANQAGIIKTVFDGLRSTFGELFATFKQTFGGIAQALSAGEYSKAAAILWAGVKLAFFQGAKAAFDAFTWLFNNGLSAAMAFGKALGQTLWNVFKAIPQMLYAALSGGASLAEILAKAINSGLGNTLNESIASAQADLAKLTAEDPKKAAAGSKAPSLAGSGSAAAASMPAELTDNEKAIEDRIKALQDETAEMKLGADAFDLMKLKAQGATAEQLRQVQTLQQYRDQLKAKAKAEEEAKKAAEDAKKQAEDDRKDLMERGKQLTEEVRTPLQVFGDKMREIDTLLAAGAITRGTALLQRDRARDELNAPMRDALKSGRNTIANINSQEALDVVLRTRKSYMGGPAGKNKAEELAASQLEEQRKTNTLLERNATTTIKIQTRRL